MKWVRDYSLVLFLWALSLVLFLFSFPLVEGSEWEQYDIELAGGLFVAGILALTHKAKSLKVKGDPDAGG